MIIVSPFKPLPSEHRRPEHGEDRIGPFDWIAALRMLAASAKPFGYPVHAISNTELPVPHFRFDTVESDLMIWILEISVAFLESAHFTEDAVFVSPDSLINNYFPTIDGFDMGICVRFEEKYHQRPILNSVQLWPVAAKEKLAAFFRECLQVAKALPGGPTWGADTIPLEKLLAPLHPGIQERAGMNVLMLPFSQMMRTIHSGDIEAIENGYPPTKTSVCVIDFKARRKKHMKAYFEATNENN